jgi:hypothetical protein
MGEERKGKQQQETPHAAEMNENPMDLHQTKIHLSIICNVVGLYPFWSLMTE